MKYYISAVYPNGRGDLTYRSPDGKGYIEAPSEEEAVAIFREYERSWWTLDCPDVLRDGDGREFPLPQTMNMMVVGPEAKTFKVLNWETGKPEKVPGAEALSKALGQFIK